MIVYVIF